MFSFKDQKKLTQLVKKIVRSRRDILKPDKVTVGWPVFDEKEILGVLASLLDMRISQGPKVAEFESVYAKVLGVRYAVAVNSGSSANLLALNALTESGDIKRGSEVIVPAATFSAVASPIIQLGLRPVYVDVEERSWNIDPQEIKKAIGPKTRVIMPVHSFGNPADMSKIMQISRKHNLRVLEDCCEAHNARIGKKIVGSFGDLATFSFFVAHNITTGEGGMIFTNNKKYYDILTSLREFGRLPLDIVRNQRFKYHDSLLGRYDTRYIFDRLGYNVRMTDIAASLGIEQLKKLDAFNKKRLTIVSAYQKVLEKYKKYLRLPQIRPGTFHSFYGYCVAVEKNAPFRREELVNFLEEQGIETRPFFGGCLPDQPAFRQSVGRIVGRLPVSRWIRDSAFFIGCHPALSSSQIRHVATSFKEFFESV